MLTRHRNEVYRLLPRWAHGINLFRLVYSIVIIVDCLGDALLAAIKIRFQGLYSNESLPRLSSERKVWQGPNESPESFALRLQQWWDIGKHWASFITMAEQLQAYFLPDSVRIEIVQNNGLRFTLSARGPLGLVLDNPLDDGLGSGSEPTWTQDSTSWNWDGDTSKWSRYWVLIDNRDANLITGGTARKVGQSGAKVGQVQTQAPGAHCIGHDMPFLNYSTSPRSDSRELRRIMEEHRAPHAHCAGIIVLLDHDAFWASPPDGTWTYWKNRNPNARYWAGTI